MYLVGAMLSSDKIKSKMGNKMNEGMLMPYKKIMDKARKESGKSTVKKTKTTVNIKTEKSDKDETIEAV